MFAERILSQAETLNLALKPEQIEQLNAYATLIEKWNHIYNLSGINSLEGIVDKHIIESLYLVPFISKGELLDLGSGAGLPGIVVAISKPKTTVYLVESIGKKCRFLSFVKATLKLHNVHIINNRIENIRGLNCAQITARAFGSMDKIITLSQHLLAENGSYLLMKGKQFKNEKQTFMSKKITIHKLNSANEHYLIKITI